MIPKAQRSPSHNLWNRFRLGAHGAPGSVTSFMDASGRHEEVPEDSDFRSLRPHCLEPSDALGTDCSRHLRALVPVDAGLGRIAVGSVVPRSDPPGSGFPIEGEGRRKDAEELRRLWMRRYRRG